MSSPDVDGHVDQTDLLIWLIQAAIRDGGAKQAAKNVTVGVAKGAATFGVNTAKGMVVQQAATGNIAAAVSTATTPNPSPLRPSNTTQAQASLATQAALTVASALVPASTAGSATETGSAVIGAVVIGEDMSRVAAAAEAFGAGVWTPTTVPATLSENLDWISNVMAEQSTIFDIGISQTREVRSPFYDLESTANEGQGARDGRGNIRSLGK